MIKTDEILLGNWIFYIQSSANIKFWKQ